MRVPRIKRLYSFKGSIAFGFMLTFIFAGSAQAIVINNSGIPTVHQYHTEGDKNACRAYPGGPTYGHAQHQWISSRGQPMAITPVVINKGTNSIELQLNLLGHHCRSNMNPVPPMAPLTPQNSGSSVVVDTSLIGTAITPRSATSSVGTVVGFSGSPANLDFLSTINGVNTRFYTNVANIPFSLSGLGSLPAGEHTVTITAITRQVNWYGGSSPRLVCVNPAPPPERGANDSVGSNCNDTPTQTSFVIRVQDTPPPPSCPVPNGNLSLPDRTPSGGPPGSAIWGPHDHHKRQNRSRVISVNDISAGGSRISIPYTGGTNHQVTLDYRPFINNYPYDRNQASVSYVSYYDTDHYQPNYSQPVYRRDPIYGPVYMVEWPQGEFWPWRDIIGYVDVLIGYRPMLVGTSPGREASGTANSPVIQPCRHRTFSASVSSGHGFLVPDREDPTSASYSGGTVSVQFNVQPGPHNGTLRIASRVTLNYTVQRSSQGAGSRSLGSRSGSILVTGGNTIPSNGSASISDTFSVSVPGSLRAGDRVCWTLSITPQQGVINVDGNRVSSSGSISSPQACSARVYDQSYLKSFGGEVVSGGGFLSSDPCAPASGQGGIYTWSRGSTATNYEGSSASLTVSSLLTINQFYSASQRTTGPHPPKGLTFANAGSSSGNSHYGGGSGNNRCITDYYEDTRDPGIHAGSWPGSLPGGAGRVQYTTPSDLTLGSLTVPVGTQAAIYVDGDVYIDRNIVYASGAGSWSVSPYFVLIAKGDIYIGSNVTRLDGLYVAQEKTIYTCASDMRGRYTVSTVYDRCQNQLYVNGGLVASDVKFLRMRNSMRDSRPAEAPNFAASSGTSAAEVIVYGPEMFLAPSPLRRTDLPIEDASTNEQSAGAYDSIKALPPVL